MSPAPAMPYRLLPAVQTLQGAAGSLENILEPLASGALCWVLAEGALYSFDKFSTAPVSVPSIIATARGAGAPGRWLRYAAASSVVPLPNGFWVDGASAPGGNGSIAAPFDTVTAAVAASPTGGTIFVLPGDYSGEAAVPVGTKTLTFIGFASQESTTPSFRAVLPTIQYASGVTPQHLTFRNISVTTEATGASNTALYFEFCPVVSVTGAGNATQIKSTGDASCTLSGEGGRLFMRGGFIGSYTANAGQSIVLEAGIFGDLTTAGDVSLTDSAWGAGPYSITAATIFSDLTTAYRLTLTVVTLSVPLTVLEAHNASHVFEDVALAVGTSDVAIDVTGTELAGIDVGDAAVATWGAPGPSGFGDAAIGGCQVTAANEVTVRFTGVVGGGVSDIVLTWLMPPVP